MQRPHRWTRGDTSWALAIALIALALRLGYALEYADHPLGRLPWVDEGAYWTRAREIGAGHLLPERPFYQDPLFPYALAVLMKAIGPGIAGLRIGLACLGALTPVVTFCAGRRGFGRAEGIVAGLLAAFYGPMVFTDGLLEKEGLAALAAALALAASARAVNGPRPTDPVWMMASGVAWGTLALLRANALAIGLVGTIWAWVVGRSSEPPRRRGRAALGFLLGFAAALAPAVAINAVVGRPPELLVTTWQAGANFYVGNGPGATGTYWAPDFVEANPAFEADAFASEAIRRVGKPLTPGQVSRYWLAEGLRRWRDAPIASLRLLFVKFGLLLRDFEIPDNQDLAFVRAVAAPRLAWAALSFGWIAPLAALGLGRKGRTPFWWLLTASTAAGFAPTALFFVVARYRVPWTPGLILLAAAGVVDFVRWAQRREFGAIGVRVILLGLPAAFLAWRPAPDPVPDRWGHAEIALALAELGEGRLESAIDALDDARAFSPGAASRVAEITAAGPVHDRIAAQVGLRRGAGRVTRLRLARWLRQLPEGRAESRRLLEIALTESPDDPVALVESAAWWLSEPGEGPRRRALEELERAARRDLSAAILAAILARDARKLPRRTAPAARLRLAQLILEVRK